MTGPIDAPTITFWVEGKPVPKGRPRVGKNRKTGKVIVYTPKRTRDYEKRVGQAAVVELAKHNADVERGKRWPLNAEYFVTLGVHTNGSLAGDLDNILKGICDGLNGIAWDDDRQIWGMTVRRVADKQQAGVRVTVTVW